MDRVDRVDGIAVGLDEGPWHWWRCFLYTWAMDDETKRILRAMTPEQRLQAASRLYHSARELKAAALRARHPDWSEEEIQRAVREAFLYARS